MLLAYREDPSFFAVAQAMGVHHQTVQRCVERALAYGPIAALDDRPRPGKEPTITAEAKAWVVNLACRKAKELGYPHELWTTRLLARHAREQGPAEGHSCLAKLAQGTLCNILNGQEIKPHKVRWGEGDPRLIQAYARHLVDLLKPSQKYLKFQMPRAPRAACSNFCVGYPRMVLVPPVLRST